MFPFNEDADDPFQHKIQGGHYCMKILKNNTINVLSQTVGPSVNQKPPVL